MGIYFPGVAPNLPTIPSASDFNTVLSSDQNTLDGTHSQHSTSQDDIAGVEEGNQGFPAVQLADAQVTGVEHHQMVSRSVEMIKAFGNQTGGFCFVGCFQTSVKLHGDSVSGCDAPVLQDVLWRVPLFLRNSGLPQSRYC